MLNRPQNCRPRLGRPIGRLCSHSPPPLPFLLSVLSVLSVLSLALAAASDPCMCAFEPLSPVQCTLIRVYYGVPRPSAQRGLPKLVCYPCLDHSLCRLPLSLALSLSCSLSLALSLALSAPFSESDCCAPNTKRPRETITAITGTVGTAKSKAGRGCTTPGVSRGAPPLAAFRLARARRRSC
jgi:hypothetical protein